MDMSRLIIVSNRLPVTVVSKEGRPEAVPSSGGLITGLQGPFDRSEGLWIGWPGDLSSFDESQREEIHDQLISRRLIPLYLDSEEIEGYYERFSNGIIWPLCHYLLDNIPYEFGDWETYEKVNQKFADLIVEHYNEGDLIWIHDYQLALVPAMVRKQLPGAKIGFFLHIPFPSSEVFRILPCREAILNGMLGADLIGFHTFSYMRHFSSCLVRIAGKETAIDQVHHEGRHVTIGIFPISIDAKRFHDLSHEERVVEEVKQIRRAGHEDIIILGVDRLDYTKGLPRRLYAMRRFFEKYPQYRGRVRMVQVAVPTRENVEAYEDYRNTVNRMVGEINGKFGTVDSTPIHYLYRSFDIHTLVSLYCAADIMLVTPLRDGMNLVAKEFIASRSDGDGVLILSEFAGAASELGEANIVNPYDADEMADEIHHSIQMSKEDRKIRMDAMRKRVFSHDVHKWAESFIERLESIQLEQQMEQYWLPEELAQYVIQKKGKKKLNLLLDYDGTLMPFQNRPELARPSGELLELLESLAHVPDFNLCLVSGRKKETLEEWFGRYEIDLFAEHGLWEKAKGAAGWKELVELKTEWKETVRPLLELFTNSTPGSFVEEKAASLAWHYRAAEKEFGAVQAKELRLHLLETYSNMPVQILLGNKVIEIRMQGVNKGLAVMKILEQSAGSSPFVAIGDDHTDEDMFAALGKKGISIRVGPGETIAEFRLFNHTAVYNFLRNLISLV